MDSDSIDLGIRWGDEIKVYTRKKRRNVFPATSSAVDEDVPVTGNVDVLRPISETLDVAQAEKVVPQTENLLVDNFASGDVPGDGAVVGNEGGGGGFVVEALISRVEDRVRISVGGGNKNVEEIRELRRTLEGELDEVRSFMKKVEDKEKVQLNSIYSGNNKGRILVGVPGGGIISRSRAQYAGGNDNVIHNRSLVRVKHSRPRPFQPPSLAVVVNNDNAVGESMEREKRTPKANQYYKNSEFLLGKDRLPSESNKKVKTNGGGKKHRGVSNHGFAFDDKYRKQLFRSCTDLLQRLIKHKYAWVFNEPVNVKALGLHDYLDIIKHPMDFGTIKTRLSQNWYKSPKEFAEDIRLVFSNAKTYNPKGQDVHIMAEELSQIFEERWAAIEAKYNPGWRYQMYHDAGLPTPPRRKVGRPRSIVHEPVPYHVQTHAPQARILERSESITGAADPRKKPSNFSHVGRPPVLKKPKAKDLNKRGMTYEEKRKLSTNLENLPSEKLDAIIQIIKKRSSALNQNDEEIEVDIDNVDTETLWELDRFVANYKKSLSKTKRKAELALQASARAAESAPVTKVGDRQIMQAVPAAQAVLAVIQDHPLVILIVTVPLQVDRMQDIPRSLANTFGFFFWATIILLLRTCTFFFKFGLHAICFQEIFFRRVLIQNFQV